MASLSNGSPWCDTSPCMRILTHQHHCNNRSCSQVVVHYRHVHTTCLGVVPEQSSCQNLSVSAVGSRRHLEFSYWIRLTCASYHLRMLLQPGEHIIVSSQPNAHSWSQLCNMLNEFYKYQLFFPLWIVVSIHL